MPSEIVNRPGAAKVISTSVKTLDRLTFPRGPIPCIRIGRAVRYDVASLHKFLKSQTQGPVA